MESNFKIPGSSDKVAYLVEKDMPKDRYAEVLNKAMEERANGKQILVAKMNKNKKFQKEQLTLEGYTSFEEFYTNPL